MVFDIEQFTTGHHVVFSAANPYAAAWMKSRYPQKLGRHTTDMIIFYMPDEKHEMQAFTDAASERGITIKSHTAK